MGDGEGEGEWGRRIRRGVGEKQKGSEEGEGKVK